MKKPQPDQVELNQQDLDDVASGKKIIDFVSGRAVPATPEEVETTQPASKQLVEDYGYPKSHMRTRPQHRVKARPSGGEYPVDIAIFHNEACRDEDLYIVFECKRSGEMPETGNDRQIFNYLRFSSASIGVWTNGDERQIFRKIVDKDQIDFEQIPNLPRMGETVDSIGKYLRRNLVAPRNLNVTFRALRNHLAGNTVGTTRDEVLATQLINLVFCKIYDEKFKPVDSLVDFRVGIGEDPEAVRRRILTVFEQVKTKYADVFDSSDSIVLDAKALSYVVGELQPFCLIEAPRDAVGEAFEVFVGSTLKGAQGQFFTPRNVIQLMVEIIKPKPADLVIDPACGPAGFLVESLRHKWLELDRQAKKFAWTPAALAEEKTSTAIKTINGIEKDSFLAKVAKAYMAIMGDGKGGIFCEDSLDKPSNWSATTKQHVLLQRFDVVLANPPFGRDIKVSGEEKLEQYDLAHKYVKGARTNKLEETQNPQILFVERCIQLAKDGGVIGLILPETYFHAPSTKVVTETMTKHNVLALIDLPHNTFRPFNNAKCVSIIFQKNRPQQEKILMIAADEMGHNHQGKPIYRYDRTNHTVSDEVWDDLTVALEELRGMRQSDYTFEVDAQTVKSEEIFIPRYYWPRLIRDIQVPDPAAIEWKTLRELIAAGALEQRAGHGSPPSLFKGKGSYPYIRVKDIINWEIYRNPTSMIPKSEFDRLTAKYPLNFEDVVYVSRGSYRIGDVGIVGPDDESVALTREIHVLRVLKDNHSGLSPYYLLYLLSSSAVAQQTKARVFLDTTMPNISDRYLDIKLPWDIDSVRRAEISKRVESALKDKWSAMANVRKLLSEIRPRLDQESEVDDLVEGGDDSLGL
jgi:type I restriction enzyme M protein